MKSTRYVQNVLNSFLPRHRGSSRILWHVAVTMGKSTFASVEECVEHRGPVAVLPVTVPAQLPGCALTSVPSVRHSWSCHSPCRLLSADGVGCWIPDSAPRPQIRPTCVYCFPPCPVCSYISKLPSQYFPRWACIEQLAPERGWFRRDSPSSYLLRQACPVIVTVSLSFLDRFGPTWYFHSSAQFENKGFLGFFTIFLKRLTNLFLHFLWVTCAMIFENHQKSRELFVWNCFPGVMLGCVDY